MWEWGIVCDCRTSCVVVMLVTYTYPFSLPITLHSSTNTPAYISLFQNRQSATTLPKNKPIQHKTEHTSCLPMHLTYIHAPTNTIEHNMQYQYTVSFSTVSVALPPPKCSHQLQIEGRVGRYYPMPGGVEIGVEGELDEYMHRLDRVRWMLQVSKKDQIAIKYKDKDKYVDKQINRYLMRKSMTTRLQLGL